MPHTEKGNTFRVCWALTLGLTVSTLFATSAAAEPSTTPDQARPASIADAVRDRWYLDISPAVTEQARDDWYLDFRPSAPPARSHRDQEES